MAIHLSSSRMGPFITGRLFIVSKVVVSVECMSIIGDCCRGTPLPSRNVLLNALEPPRREKRGSVRMANMIANKGLPVELEPTEGLFAGTAAAAAAAGTTGGSAVAGAAAAAGAGASVTESAGGIGETETAGGVLTEAAAAVVKAAAAAVAASETFSGTSSPQATRISPSASTDPDVVATAAASLNDGVSVAGTGKKTAGEGPKGFAEASAAWYSSTAKARERTAGRSSEQALGAAAKMRAEVSSRVLPMLQGFVPGPVTDLLAVRVQCMTPPCHQTYTRPGGSKWVRCYLHSLPRK